MSSLQGYKLKLKLLDLRAQEERLPSGDGGIGIPMRPAFRDDLLHKLNVLYLHFQKWEDVCAELKVTDGFVHGLRVNKTTPGRAFLARLDNLYRVIWLAVDANVKKGKRVDEGAPRLLKWRERNAAANRSRRRAEWEKRRKRRRPRK